VVEGWKWAAVRKGVIGITDMAREKERGNKLALLGPPVGHWDDAGKLRVGEGEDGRI
jgi:hypothetical protein